MASARKTRTRRAAAAVSVGLGVLSIAATGAAAAPPPGSDASHATKKTTVLSVKRKRKEVVQRVRPPRATPHKKHELGSSEPSSQTTSPEVDSPQIVGGSLAPQGAYPWFTSVQTTSGFAFCGGTLVSSTWVLTAAHCVDGGTQPSSLRLVIGSNKLSQPSQGEVRGVTQIIVNPAWNPTTFDNDVALLRLDSPSTKPWARLARPGDPTAPGQTVRAIGHGATSEGGLTSDDLLQVDLPVQSDATMSSPSVYGSRFIGASMIGAGPLAGGQDTCQGDSGGPLFVPSGVQVPLVGDTSWGDGCARPNRPGIYGEVWQGAMRSFVDANVARPANDDFGGQTISGAAGRVFGSNTDATWQPGEVVGAGTADTTVWYTWTAPESGPTTMNLREAAFDTTLGVFTGNNVAALTAVAGNDDANGTLQSKLSFNATAGTTYRIVVDGFAAAHGTFGLQWAQNPPAHDDFVNAKAIAGATGKDYDSNARSTGEPGEPSHVSTPDTSVWYSWTAPESGNAVFNTRESNFDTTLAVYTGSSVNALTQLAANDDTNSLQSKVVVPVVAGTTYHVAVDGWGAATGNIGLQWSVNRPANDDFADARVLPGLSGITSATSVRATGEPGERDYHGGAIADNSVWFRWTPSQSGPAVVRLGSVGSTLFPGVAVYTGSPVQSLTKVAEGPTSVSLNVVAGTQYSIAVDGNGGSTGSFTLEWLLARCNGLDATIVGQGAIAGTPGDDVIVGSAGNDSIDAGAGNDTICALGGNDSITGGAGADLERGGVGNDTFRQLAVADGADVLIGESGTDTVSYAARTAPLSVSLNGLADDGLAGEADNVTATVENVTGGSSRDEITGSGVNNRLSGGGGDDVLRGGLGNDSLVGGAGADRLFGDDGNDALNLVDGVGGNDGGDGGLGTDTATLDAGDSVVNVP
jgi:Trypsin/RTX calcium-binding nonapeptide repeat (4 copies)